INACLGAAREVVYRQKGFVIKTLGDAILCAFDTAEQALQAACEIHEALEGIHPPRPDLHLSMQIGSHYGSVILDGGDAFGDTVNIASRMATLAKGAQSITTRDLVEQLPPALKTRARIIGQIPVRGKKETLEVHEIIRLDKDVTIQITLDKNTFSPIRDELLTHGVSAQLVVCYRTKQVLLGQERKFAVLGRSLGCDLVIQEPLASREHVTIELRRDGFVLIDRSTNGTYMRGRNTEESFLRWEEMQLPKEGEISLGCPFSENPQELVHFRTP
ncbi:MAG: FHA domain-containing protein, partial [Gammaproteobacteria bacterium]